MMVGEIFEEIPSDGKVATGFLAENGWDARAEHLPFQQGKSEGIYGLSLLTVISLFYTMGAVGVFLFFCLFFRAVVASYPWQAGAEGRKLPISDSSRKSMFF